MLEYDRIDISEGIDIKKRKANSMQNLAIINHNGNHYHVNFVFMSKKGAFNLIKNAVIIDKREHYKCRKHKCFSFKAKIK